MKIHASLDDAALPVTLQHDDQSLQCLSRIGEPVHNFLRFAGQAVSKRNKDTSSRHHALVTRSSEDDVSCLPGSRGRSP